MALHIPKAPGMPQMLKDGARYLSGLEETVIRNIHACREVTRCVRTTYGPMGLCKLVVNHIKKIYLTNDVAAIVKELQFEHPAAKIMVLASQTMDAEIGDGTNFVLLFAGSLLDAAEDLLKLGILPIQVIEGFEMAMLKCTELLPELCCMQVEDMLDEEQVTKAIRSAVMSKQYGNEDFVARLAAKACFSIAKSHAAAKLSNIAFNVDNVRVCKVEGRGVHDSHVVQGMVFTIDVESVVKRVRGAKIAVYTNAVDIAQLETKGTVLMHTAADLLSYSAGEEKSLEQQIKAIAETGANVIVSGNKFGDMAMHFINKYGLMAVKLSSKFELRRLAKTVNATIQPQLKPPPVEELGYCESAYCDEIGGTRVAIFKQNDEESKVVTVVIRGATDNAMDDVERAIDDGVNIYKVLTRDGRLLAGAGAVEAALSCRLNKYANTVSGLEQYAIRKFAQAFEQFPRILAENAGLNANQVSDALLMAHQAAPDGETCTIGVDIEKTTETTGMCNAVERAIFDPYLLKMWGIRYGVITANTILRVDQMIMARKAGGPKPRDGNNSDGE